MSWLRAPAALVPLARVWLLAKPHWRLLLVGSLFMVVGSAAALILPFGIRMVMDDAQAVTRAARINQAAVTMAGVSLLFGAASGVRFWAFSVAGERVVSGLRERLYERILAQDVAFFDVRRTGELVSRLGSDTSVLQNAVTVNIAKTMRIACQGLGAIALLFYISPRLTGLILAIVPPVTLAAVIYGRRLKGLAGQVQDAVARAGAIAEESIAGLRTVRSFDAEPNEQRRYAVAIGESLGLARLRIRSASAFITLGSFVTYTAAVIVFWYGGRLMARGMISSGALASFLVYTLIAAHALSGLVDAWADSMRAAGAAERIFELIDRQPAVAAQGGFVPARIQGRVTLTGVRFSYPNRPEALVLDGVDLELAAGEVVALVGASGAGKSTIAALISRFYDPVEGRVALDGDDVRGLDPRWLRRQIGMVAQEPVLFSTSIADNIRYGRPQATFAEVQAAARAANAHDFVSSLPRGYDTPVGERGTQLAGGQKQRVAIARAMLKDPRILLLDEATSALDAENEHLVKEALERLLAGRTTLIISHRLSTVIGADRVLVLDRGRVVQSGTHARLVSEDGPYRKLVERQSSLLLVGG